MESLRTTSIAAVLAIVLLPGCAEKDLGITPPQDAAGNYVIRMTSNLTFEPAEARIPVGATITWVNDATMDHDVAGYEGDPIKSDREDFSSTEVSDGKIILIPPGGHYNHTFSEKGTWTIWCHTHHEERMKGIIHVT